jgi:exonuclease VII small subunit
MGVIPLPVGHSSAQETDDCRLCAEMRAPDDGFASAVSRMRHVLPLAFVATVGLVFAVVDRGAAGLVGAGVAAGICACALYVTYARRSLLRSAHEAHARELQTVVENADMRVELVVKQYEWAVADVARLKGKFDQAEAFVQALTERGREREHQNEQLVRQISRLRGRLAEIAMAASLTQAGKQPPARPIFEAIYFTWGLHLDGPRARLELQTAANADSPTRLRVMDRDGQIVAVSGMAVVSLDGELEFQLEPPLDLIVDLDEGREINYAIEALVEDDWKPVRLKDSGRRTQSVVDVHGRLSRAPEIRDATRQSEPTDARRSTLN